jgi:cellulose synthase/poly-beta-1,6-N-acetylglucosamine synthase-like glycosyltransferase
MNELLLYFSLSVVIYIYIGYPCMVIIASLFLERPLSKGNFEPTVSILIAAFNEADFIRSTLLNKQQLAYPKSKLEIIVISDASDDGTDSIVKEFTKTYRNVKLLRQEQRNGKTAALNIAVHNAKGDILVFSDANSIYRKDALQKLMRNFHDRSVGYVTGKMLYTNRDGTMVGDGCTAYMRYENFLRKAESAIGSIVGVDGGIDAVRKSLFKDMRPDQLPDFVLPLMVREQGYRVVYEPDAILTEETLKKDVDEYRMRVRVALRAMWALSDMRQMLSLRKYPLFGWQLWSHKVLRYISFFFIIIALVSNLVVLSSGLHIQLIFTIQLSCYLLSLLVPVVKQAGPLRAVARICRYFILLNISSAHAFLLFIRRRRVVIWSPRKG